MKPLLPITVPIEDHQRCRPSMLRWRRWSRSVWTGLKKQSGWGGISGYLPQAYNIFVAQSNDTHRRGIVACCLLEFFLNGFSWIQRIQWIMTKSKSGMVTKVITYLLTDTLPVLVIKSEFLLLPLGSYLLPVTTRNRYQSTGSSGKFFLPLHQGM